MWGLLALFTAAFTAVMTQLLPAGLLPQMGGSLHVSQGRVGFLVSVYAVASFGAAIPLTAALRGLPCRPVLLGVLTGFALFNAVTAFSSSYPLTLLVRLLAGAMDGTLWALCLGIPSLPPWPPPSACAPALPPWPAWPWSWWPGCAGRSPTSPAAGLPSASRCAASPPCLASPPSCFQPIDAAEVAHRLAELAVGPPQGRVPEMGGPPRSAPPPACWVPTCRRPDDAGRCCRSACPARPSPATEPAGTWPRTARSGTAAGSSSWPTRSTGDGRQAPRRG